MVFQGKKFKIKNLLKSKVSFGNLKMFMEFCGSNSTGSDAYFDAAKTYEVGNDINIKIIA